MDVSEIEKLIDVYAAAALTGLLASGCNTDTAPTKAFDVAAGMLLERERVFDYWRTVDNKKPAANDRGG